jgi:hypothetical protein
MYNEKHLYISFFSSLPPLNKNMSFKDEHQPLLTSNTSSVSTIETPQSYDAIATKLRDEEELGNSSDSTIDEHDSEYLIKHRLGDASLSRIVLWYVDSIQLAFKGCRLTLFDLVFVLVDFWLL